MVVDVPYLDYFVHAYVWRVNVGRISLYLLDTDNEMNSEFDRPITHQLYGGDWENRLKQEILLGIGGILTLKKLGIKKDVYHCNEGHAALINVQRICDYVADRSDLRPGYRVGTRFFSLYCTYSGSCRSRLLRRRPFRQVHGWLSFTEWVSLGTT